MRIEAQTNSGPGIENLPGSRLFSDIVHVPWRHRQTDDSTGIPQTTSTGCQRRWHNGHPFTIPVLIRQSA